MAFWSTALALTGFAAAVLYWPFIFGGAYHFHDSLVPATEIGLFYDRLFGADSWLWSAAHNGGHPLWVSLETMPFFDPIALAIYAPAVALEWPWWTPYHLTILAWMLAFALAGGLCTQEVTGNRWAALLTFAILFAGPLALAVPAQSNGFLVPFRYFPLTIFFYLRLRRSATPTNMLAFATVLAFGLAGYQSVYVLVLFLTLAASEVLVGPRSYLQWLGRLLRPRVAAMLLIPLAGVAPLVLWLAYLGDLVSISRTYRHGRAYFMDLGNFTSDFLYPYADLIYFGRPIDLHHGSTFLGLFVLPCILFGIRSSVRATLAQGWRRSAPAARMEGVLWVWLLIAVALTNGLFGLEGFVRDRGDLIGIRNYGFLWTACLFIAALLAGYGFSEIVAGRYSLKEALVDILVFAALAACSFWLIEGRREGGLAIAGAVAVFALVALLWHRLPKTIEPGRIVVPLVVLVQLELAATIYGFLPSLQRAADLVGESEAAELARLREPSLGAPAERLPDNRQFRFLSEDHWPYQFEGPAVFKSFFAVSEPYEFTPLSSRGYHGITHFFRTAAYDRLLREQDDPELLKAVLGVTRPILELAPEEAFARGPEGLSLVLGVEAAEAAPAAPVGRVSGIAYEGDRLSAVVEVFEPALLVYRDNMAEGWRARVDGAPVEIAVVDRVNKAVALQPGSHRVEFLYRPWGYLAAFTVRAAVLGGAALACLLWGLHGRRRRPAKPDRGLAVTPSA